MIKIYGDIKDAKGRRTGLNYIKETLNYFSLMIKPKDFNDTDRMIIKTIDNAEYIGSNLFKTPFGIATKEQLSSGCITALVVNYWLKNNMKNKIIRVSSCGPNALQIIFDLVDNTDIALIQKPTSLGDLETNAIINYNDGEFIGDLEEYRVHLLEVAYIRSKQMQEEDERYYAELAKQNGSV